MLTKKSKKLLSLLPLIAWVGVTLVAVTFKPFETRDQLHFLGIAWEMWMTHNHLYTIAQGQLDVQKPIMLYWLIHLGWFIFGVNNWWPKLVIHLAGLGCIGASFLMIKDFFNKKNNAAYFIPMLMLAAVYWVLAADKIRFDLLFSFFVLASLWLLIRGASPQRSNKVNFGLCAVAIASGVLTKGPLIYLYVLPVMLTYRWWSNRIIDEKTWYWNCGLSLLISILLSALWIALATYQAGWVYFKDLVLGQLNSRVGSHQWHLWFYVRDVVLITLPWVLWPPILRGILNRHANVMQRGFRKFLVFLASAFVPSFLLFSFFVKKHSPFYLLPDFPLVMMSFAVAFFRFNENNKNYRFWYVIPPVLLFFIVSMGIIVIPIVKPYLKQSVSIAFNPAWGILLLIGVFFALFFSLKFRSYITQMIVIFSLSNLFYFSVYLGYWRIITPKYQLQSFSQQINSLEQQGHPVVHVKAKISGYLIDDQNYEFLGKLAKPLPYIDYKKLPVWVKQHPQGWVVFMMKDSAECLQLKPPYWQHFRHAVVTLWPGKKLLELLKYKPPCFL